MKGLRKQIAAYHAVHFDAKGEAWDKIVVLQGLEDHLGDSRVLAFLLGILADTSEYHAARLHLLKWFEADPAADARTHRRIGECIAATLRAEALLRKDDSCVIKAWLARVISIYHDVPAIAGVCTERVRDQQEYPDVRMGCLIALRHCGPTDEIVVVLREVAAGTDDAASWARATLREWDRAEAEDNHGGSDPRRLLRRAGR